MLYYLKRNIFTFRGATFLAFVAIFAVLTAGCGSKEEDTAALIVGIGTDVNNWFLEEFPEGDSRLVWSQVYETLVRLTPNLKFEPGLAESWSSSDDGKTWEFQLRKDVKFHDGTPLTSDAVIFSYGPRSYARKTVLRVIESIEAEGLHTVRFRLKHSIPLPYYLSHVAWPIMGPGCVDDNGRFIRPVGTGPFKFERQTEDQEIVLTKNRDYRGDVPEIRKVKFKVIPDAVARVIALESGGIDMAVKISEGDVKRLERKEGITVHRKLTTFTDFVQFNTRKGLFRELDLRRAVACAIDTEELVKTVLEGVGEAAKGRPLSPIMLYSDPTLDLYEYDLSKARDLIARSGWKDTDGDGIVEKDGRPLRCTMLVSQNENVGGGGRFFVMAEAIQGALRQIGMDIRIMKLEEGAFLKAEKDGDFDMLIRTGFYVWSGYPRHFFLHFSKNMFGHYDDPEFDKLVLESDSSIDPKLQRESYFRLQQRVIEKLPAFYLVHQEKVVATGPRVRDYRITSEYPWLNLNGVYLQQ